MSVNASILFPLFQVTEVDTCKPMCTVVFENKNFKAENAVLDQFGGQLKNQSNKVSMHTRALHGLGQAQAFFGLR